MEIESALTVVTGALLDPTQHYLGRTKGELMEACGLCPHWILARSDKPMLDLITEGYGFPIFELEGGEVGADMIYRYPEDEPLHPILLIQRGEEKYLQYEHGFIAIVNKNGNQFVTRCD